MNISERNKKAHELQKSGDIENAINLYELNVQLNADSPETYNRLYTIYNLRNDKENIVRIMKCLLVIHEAKLKVFETADKTNKRYHFNLEKQKLKVDFVRKVIQRNSK
jgi:hypothetical protein